MDIHTIGIDLGKTIFHLIGLNEKGEVVERSCDALNALESQMFFFGPHYAEVKSHGGNVRQRLCKSTTIWLTTHQ